MATLEAIREFMETAFPQAPIVIEAVDDKYALIRHRASEKSLRPGGSISGPMIMTMADTALYIAIFGTIGIVPMAVTTSLNINFLSMPRPDKDLIAECRLLKVGQRLAIGEVSIYSEGKQDAIAAHATGTYSIPPEDKRHPPA